jgi:hypothetical protein
MHRIDQTNVSATLPGFNAVGATAGYFEDENEGTGAPGTEVDKDWLNTIQEEPISILTAAGIAPTKGTLNQVLQSTKRLFSGNVTTVTATGALTLDNCGLVLVDATAGNVVITLPAANAMAAASFDFVRIDSVTGHTITVNCAGADVIDHAMTSFTLPQRYLQRSIKSNATQWYTKNQTSPALAGSSRNLVGSSAGAVKTASWTADQLVAATALNGVGYIGSSLALNFNGGGVGAGEMDTGVMPTSGALYIYAIYNPDTNAWSTVGTTAGAGATIYGGANMPAGYTASCLIWSGITSGTNLPFFYQADRVIQITDASALSGGTASTFTSVSLSTIVPPNAKAVSGWGSNATAGNNNSYISGDSAGNSYQTWGGNSSGGLTAPFYALVMNVAQTIYYKIQAGNTSLSIFVNAYAI